MTSIKEPSPDAALTKCRWLSLLLVLGVFAVACGGSDDAISAPGGGTDTRPTARAERG